MKKFLLVFLGLVFVLPVFSNTAELTVTGNVSGFLSIASDVPTAVITLDPMAGEEAHSVAVITERSNKPGGYEVRVDSARGWQLDAWNGTEYNTEFFIPYDFSYDGVRTSGPSDVVLITDTLDRTTGQGVDKPFTIHTTVPELTPQSAYRDIITFTISSK